MSSSQVTRPLGSMVLLDPETLPAGTRADFSFRYLDITSASGGRLKIPDEEMQYRDAPSRARRIVRNNDVLMSTVRPNLKAFAHCSLTEGNYIASTGFAVLRAIDGNDPRYVLYALLSDQVARQIERFVVGSNYPAINTADVKRLQVPAHRPAEQSKIAKVLAAVDGAIEHTEALISKYQQIKAGLMHDLFTHGVTREGHLRPSHAQQEKLYKPSPLGPIPVEWTHTDLAECLECPPKNGFSPREVDGWSNLQVLGLSCLTKDGFEPNQLKHIALSKNAFDSLLKEGDLLISRSNTQALVGLCGIYRDVGSPCIYPDLMMRLCPNGRTSSSFLEALLLSPHMRRQVTGAASGTSGSMQKLNSRTVRHLAFALPPKEEQERILRAVEAPKVLLDNARKELLKLCWVKLGIMNDLLSGLVPIARTGDMM